MEDPQHLNHAPLDPVGDEVRRAGDDQLAGPRDAASATKRWSTNQVEEACYKHADDEHRSQ